MTTKSSAPISIPEAFFVHLICGLGLALAFWIARYVYSTDLVADPSHTLFLVWVIECPIVILLYSRYRQDREKCSYWKAVGRGILGIPAGAIINAFGAIVLGAPIGAQFLTKTLNWSIVMSLFNVVPSACVFGSSWTDWQRLFAYTKKLFSRMTSKQPQLSDALAPFLSPTGTIEHMICLPAHGAIIGAWFGAWPMPLDWERPWQEWPICVSYGAVMCYLTAMVASLGLSLVHGDMQLQHLKRE